MTRVNSYWLVLFEITLVASMVGQTPLNYLGQVGGGSAFRTYYKGNKLYAGVGTSLWVYDASDVSVKNIIARGDFRSLIMDIKVTDDNIIFVAANHDGLWALDGNYSSLPVLAHLEMNDDTVAVDLTFIPPDTLYLTDLHAVRVLRFTGNNFEEISRFAEGDFQGTYPASTDRRGQHIVVAKRHARFWSHYGVIELYRTDTLPVLLDTIRNDSLWGVEDIRFADLRDDIVYVLGGSIDVSLSKGALFALQIQSDSLFFVAHKVFDIDSAPAGVYAALVRRLASWNDILFVVTTASVIPGNTSTLTPPVDLPVIDARQLPDTLIPMGHVIPGLWYFDVAIKDSNTIAIASEWYGIRWMDVSGLYQGDTLIDENDMISQFTTGGWGKKSHLLNDTLWLAWSGYGVGIFKTLPTGNFLHIGSLIYPFAQDVKIIDTLAFVALWSYGLGIFNLRPWFEGGDPETLDIRYTSISRLAQLETNIGKRLVFQKGKKGFYLLNPDNLQRTGPFLYQWDSFKSKVGDMIGSGDTLFLVYLKKYNGSTSKYIYLAAFRIVSDTIDTIANTQIGTTTSLTWETYKMSREGNTFVVSFETSDSFSVYSFYGTGFTFQNSYSLGNNKAIKSINLHNGYVYVAEGISGLEVYQNPTSPTLMYYFSGSGGAPQSYWYNDQGVLFQGGVHDVAVGNDGKIYVTDYQGGVFLLAPISDNTVAGDIDGDGVVDYNDLVYLGNFLFYNGPSPVPYERGDVNGDCEVKGDDLTYLSHYIFHQGPAPLKCLRKNN